MADFKVRLLFKNGGLVRFKNNSHFEKFKNLKIAGFRYFAKMAPIQNGDPNKDRQAPNCLTLK